MTPFISDLDFKQLNGHNKGHRKTIGIYSAQER